MKFYLKFESWFSRICLKMSSAKWWPFRIGLNVLYRPRNATGQNQYQCCILYQRCTVIYKLVEAQWSIKYQWVGHRQFRYIFSSIWHRLLRQGKLKEQGPAKQNIIPLDAFRAYCCPSYIKQSMLCIEIFVCLGHISCCPVRFCGLRFNLATS